MGFGKLFRKSEEQSLDALIDFKAGNIPIAKAAALVGMDVETFSRHCASSSSLGEIMPIRPGDSVDAADLYTYLYRREHAGKIPDNRDWYSLEEAASILDIPIENMKNWAGSGNIAVAANQGNGQCMVSRYWIEDILSSTGDFSNLLPRPGYVPLEVREWSGAIQQQEETDGKLRPHARNDAVSRATNEFNRLLARFEPEAVAEALEALNKSKSG